MKVTVVSNECDNNGGGLAFSCLRFVEMLKAIGHEVFLLSSSIDTQEVIQGGYNPTLCVELAMEKKLKSDIGLVIEHDIIISFGGGLNGYYGALLANKTNRRFWIMFRGSDANLCKWNPNLTFYNTFACDRAEHIICLSEEIASNIKQLHNQASKFVIIPNPGTRINEHIKDLNSDTLIIGTGTTNLNEKKGVTTLLSVTSLLNKMLPDKTVKLELAGHIDDDFLKQYKARVASMGLQHQVVFHGKLCRKEFQKKQSTWDIYVQTSVCEGMGNSVVDAMSRGIPVALSDTGFVAEYAKNRFNQIVFSSFNPETIAEELCRLICLPHFQERYNEFYESFFQAISPGNIMVLWRNLFDNRQSLNLALPTTESLLSVALHDIQGEIHDNITTPISVFNKFVEDVSHAGYRLCSMRDYLQSPQEERHALIVCTFDDGYEGIILNALPIMNKYDFTATVFVCTDYFGIYNDWNYKDKICRRHMNVRELQELKKNNWEIGSHGVSHQSLLRLNDEDVTNQLLQSKQMLEDLFGRTSSYAYPYGDFSPYIEKQVKKYYDSAFLLTQGGVFMPVDKHRIHRYYISEINQIIRGI